MTVQERVQTMTGSAAEMRTGDDADRDPVVLSDDGQPLRVGQRVRVWQEIERREGDWALPVEGVLCAIRREPAGSWFAHGKEGRLWLTRLEIRKDDGELSSLVVDRHTRIERLDGARPS